MGDETVLMGAQYYDDEFLSTSPVWGTQTTLLRQWPRRWEFLSTSPVWGTSKYDEKGA